MKSITIHLSICLTLLSVFCSCSSGPFEEGDSIYTTHFIQSVTCAENLECRAVPGSNIITLSFTGRSLERIGHGSYEEFLCSAGDTSYNRTVVQDPSVTSVYSNSFVSIDIVSSEPFNGIPSGASLSGQVVFRSATARPYIESAYSQGGDWTEPVMSGYVESDGTPIEFYDSRMYDFHPVIKPLSSLTPEDLSLLWSHSTVLEFTSVPEILSHVFTVTVRDSSGVLLQSEVPFTFVDR